MTFDEPFLKATGAWQLGWREKPERRDELAAALKTEAQKLPAVFRSCATHCFRKRFLYKNDLPDLILNGFLREGPTSWTIEKSLAENFKGLWRGDAVTAAIFKHLPQPSEVILNIPSLWADPTFVEAAQKYGSRGTPEGKALLNFRADQGEVVLEADLRSQEIISMTGIASAFDELVAQAGITDEDARDRAFKTLIDQNIYPGEPGWISEEGAQRVVQRVLEAFKSKVKALKEAEK